MTVYNHFGAGPDDVTVNLATGVPVGGTHLTIWTAQTGGTQITDLIGDLATITSGQVVSSSATGNVGRYSFRAPNTYSVVWADSGTGARWELAAQEIAAQMSTALSQAASASTAATAASASAATAAASAATATTRSNAAQSTADTALAIAQSLQLEGAAGAGIGRALLPADPQVGVADPRLIYAGGVAGASIEMSFPYIARDPNNGRVLVLFKDGQDSVTAGIGNVKLGYSDDNGISWSSPVTVYGPTGINLSGPAGISVLSDGRYVAAILQLTTTGGTASYRVALSYSSDLGQTWTVPVQITNHGFTSYVVVSSPVVELQSGDLILPLYGQNGAGNTFIKVMASVDNGATWAVRGSFTVASIDLQEPALAEIAPGSLVLIARCSDHNTRKWTSTDAGVTWSAAVTAWSNFNSRVSMALMTSGRWLLLDRDLNGAAWVRYSDDSLSTFSAPQFVVSPDIRTTYEDLVETAPGRALMVYGAELWGAGGSSNPTGDIWMRYLTDGVGTTPDGQVTGTRSKDRAGAAISSLLAWDTFRRPDNAYALGAMDSGHKYRVITTGGTAFGLYLASQKANAHTSQSSDGVTDVGVADVDLEGEFTWLSGVNTGFGLTFRCAADTSRLLAVIGNGGANVQFLSCTSGGVFTTVVNTALTLPCVVGKYARLRVKVYGSNIKIYVDDDLVIQTTSAINPTATQHGIHLSNNSSSAQNCRRWTVRSAA